MDVRAVIANHPVDDVAFACGPDERTWARLDDHVARTAGALQADHEPGDVVAVLGDTSIAFIEVVFAALTAGLTILPLHTRYPTAELDRAIGLAQPELLVLVDDAAERTAAGLSATIPQRTAVDLRAGAPLAEAPAVDPESAAVLLFTSGTAGSPRLAVLSRANITASLSATVAGAAPVADAARVMLGVMPLTHVLGLISVVGAAVVLGATLVLPADTEVDAVVADIERHGVGLLVAPPIFWYRLVEAELAPTALVTVSVGLSGAAPLTGALARRVEQRFDLRLRQGYGLTEATSGITTSMGTEAPAGSVGRPMQGVLLRLVDEFGDDALIGDVGEVLAKGPQIFSGYLGDPEATAEVLDDDGWLRTGDLGVVDEQGFLYIVGRSKDQIISAGFNVHPGEVEQVLAAHDGVRAAAVVGEPDREYGEVVIGFVVPADPSTPPPADDLIEHCAERLAGYKVPTRIEFTDELPRSATGKLRRRTLRNT